MQTNALKKSNSPLYEGYSTNLKYHMSKVFEAENKMAALRHFHI